MKLLVLIILLMLSFSSFAVSINKKPTTSTPPAGKILISPKNTTPLLAADYLSAYAFKNIKTTSIASTSALAFSDVTYTKVNWQNNYFASYASNSFSSEQFSHNKEPLKGINAKYHTEKFIIELDYLNDNSLVKKNEMISLKTAFTVWSFNTFNLAIGGEISAGNREVMNQTNLHTVRLNNENDYIINSSLSFSGTYLLNKSWVVTGSVASHYLTTELSAPVLINKGSDNIAIIGTTYSF